MSLDLVVDELLILIVARFERAQDVARLGQTCRRLCRFVQTEGWKQFARARFPALNLAPTPNVGWSALSRSLTWQSRCWDRRSIAFMRLPLQRFQPPPTGGRTTRAFHTMIDAHLNVGTGEELVAWGAGNDVVARYRRTASRSDSKTVQWSRFGGFEAGYRNGVDDVVSLKIVQNVHGKADDLALLAGRASGDISMLRSLPDGFMEVISTFAPLSREDDDGSARDRPNKFYSLDVSPDNRRMVASTGSDLVLYSLPQEKLAEVQPTTSLSIRSQRLMDDSWPHCARWMADSELLVVASANPAQPISFVQAMPSGFAALTPSATNIAVTFEVPVAGSQTIFPHSLQPLNKATAAGRSGNLVMSAWRDGTIRLQDIRTASAFDMVYQDNINITHRYGSLLPMGNNFVAGGLEDVTIKIFDFRWSKHYHHTDALACGSETPFPRPPQPYLSPPKEPSTNWAKCDYARGLRCRFHHLSRQLYHRPNCSFYLTRSLTRPRIETPGVWSLARSADVAPNFYIGVTGGVVEAGLRSDEDGAVDPNFGFTNDHYYGRGFLPRDSALVQYLESPLMETGDGLAAVDNHRSVRLPILRQQHGSMRNQGMDDGQRRHRLDLTYQYPMDFSGAEQSSEGLGSFRNIVRPI